jgi:hypothetical protein
MSERITWVKGKMFFPPDVDPADVDWEPLPESTEVVVTLPCRSREQPICPSIS